ncbi:MAG: hypothetical protein ACOYNV_07245 [Propionivibrio sp.]
MQSHEFDQAPQQRAAQSQGRVRDGVTKEVTHGKVSFSEVVEGPNGHPVSVKERVDDLLQSDQFQDHGESTPWFRVEAEAGYQVNVKDSLQHTKPISGLLMVLAFGRTGLRDPAPSVMADNTS